MGFLKFSRFLHPGGPRDPQKGMKSYRNSLLFDTGTPRSAFFRKIMEKCIFTAQMIKIMDFHEISAFCDKSNFLRFLRFLNFLGPLDIRKGIPRYQRCTMIHLAHGIPPPAPSQRYPTTYIANATPPPRCQRYPTLRTLSHQPHCQRSPTIHAANAAPPPALPTLSHNLHC